MHPINVLILIKIRQSDCSVCYLSPCDAVDDSLQCFVTVTFEDSFYTASSGGNGLPHRHVQVVVVFLGGKVLNHVKREKTIILPPAES